MSGWPRVVVAVALAAAAGGATSAPAFATAAPVFGIGDQRADMFGDQRWSALPLRQVRYAAPWDMFSDRGKLALVDAWMSEARRTGARPLVAFDRSWTHGRRTRAPTLGQYQMLLWRFHRRYPEVRQFTPWNEANHQLQPTFRRPRLAAQYYRVMKRRYRGMTVTSPALLDWRGPTPVWVRRFQRWTGHRVRLWALHVYGDMNRRSMAGLTSVASQLKGRIWVTEAGGWVRFGKRWPHNPRRAAASTRFIFKTAWRFRARVGRWYLYQWRGSHRSASWDSGLVNYDGSARPGLRAVRSGLRRLAQRQRALAARRKGG